MKKIKKTIYNESPAIRILNNSTFCQKWLCMSDWFKDYYEPQWEWDMSPNFNINNENVEIFFESAIETYLIFESENLQKEIYNWLENNNLQSSEYWKKLADPIIDKLKSDSIAIIKEGLCEFKDWVNNYNNEYVDRSKNRADLSVFGYDHENWEEGDLWPNSLFDNLLEKHKNELSQTDLIYLVHSLFNKNEDFADCKATYTSLKYLLENRTSEIEFLIIEATISAIEGHEPGHRYFERSLLDRLVDDIFPTFSVDPIIKLLEKLHSDNIRRDGDNFISLAHIALEKQINDQQRKKLTDLIDKYKS